MKVVQYVEILLLLYFWSGAGSGTVASMTTAQDPGATGVHNVFWVLEIYVAEQLEVEKKSVMSIYSDFYLQLTHSPKSLFPTKIIFPH